MSQIKTIKNLINVVKSKLHNHDNKETLDDITATKIYSYDTHLANESIHKNDDDNKKLNEISLVDGGGGKNKWNRIYISKEC